MPAKKLIRHVRRGAFTLVEMLVVLVILGILAALTLAGVYSAMNAARNASIGLELNQLEQAVKQFQSKYSAYPPDFTPPARRLPLPNYFGDFVKKAFPLLSVDPAVAVRGHWVPAERRASGNPTEGLDQAEALVFWLGGYSEKWLRMKFNFRGSKKLYGFRADPRNPFVLSGDGLNENGWLRPTSFDFKEERLDDKDGDGWYEYYPQKSNAPYVYFEAHSYVVYATREGRNWLYSLEKVGTPTGYVGPYAAVTSAPQADFANPDSFQIISAGLDHEYGTPGESLTSLKVFPTGEGYTRSDEDNIANFSDARTLGDARP